MKNYFSEEEQIIKNLFEKAEPTSKLSDKERRSADKYAQNATMQARLEYNAHMAKAKDIASRLYFTI